jgi:hypothetical protein
LIGGRVEHERWHLDICRVDGSELNGLAEIKEVIGIGEGYASHCGLIKKCIDFEVIRERFRGILSWCCPRLTGHPARWLEPE